MMKLILSFFVVIFSFCNVNGQNHPSLSDFTYIKERNQVILIWTLKRGASCNGLGIFRSFDKENFELIGQIEGICGSSEEAVTYTFVDKSPNISGPNYYELSIGFEGKTEPPLLVEYFQLAKGGLAISPNPTLANQSPTIRWLNPDKDLCVIKVYKPDGSLLQTMNLNDEELSSEFTKFFESELRGIYLITVENTVTGERFAGQWLRTEG